MDQNRLSFWLQTQAHIHENIKFADSKAAQIIAIDVALIGALYVASEKWPDSWKVAGLVVGIGLGFGVLAAVSVVRPRGEQNQRRGPGICDSIRISMSSESSFMRESEAASDEKLSEQQRELIFDRACIDRKKYAALRLSLRVSVVSWLFAFALFAFARVQLPPNPSLERTFLPSAQLCR